MPMNGTEKGKEKEHDNIIDDNKGFE